MPKKKLRKKAVPKKTKKKTPPTPKGRGGKRKGAGRPKGSGKFGCATKAIRVPIHMTERIQNYIMKQIKKEQKEMEQNALEDAA